MLVAFFAVLASTSRQPSIQPKPATITIIGKADDPNVKRIQSALPSMDAEFVEDTFLNPKERPANVRLYLNDAVRHAILVVPSKFDTQWLTSRDKFVPKLEKEIDYLKTVIGKKSTLTLMAGASSEGSQDWYQNEYLPLAKQAARESGVSLTIIPETEDGLKVELSSQLADWPTIVKSWKVVAADSFQAGEGEPSHAIDGDLSTYWHTEYDPETTKYPHYITVDTGALQSFVGFRYVPRQDGGTNGLVARFTLEVSDDGTTWTTVLDNQAVKDGSQPALFSFDKPIATRYFRFTALKEQNGGPWASAAEIELIP